jgi:hypothetical protein
MFPPTTSLPCSTYHPQYVYEALRECQGDRSWTLTIDATSGVSKQNEAERTPSAEKLRIDQMFAPPTLSGKSCLYEILHGSHILVCDIHAGWLGSTSLPVTLLVFQR